jgi:hypothetical protein
MQFLNASLPDTYRIGIVREDVASPWTGVDGSAVAQLASMGLPYGHWTWTHAAYADNFTYNCAAAHRPYAFDYYLGQCTKQPCVRHFHLAGSPAPLRFANCRRLDPDSAAALRCCR